MSPGCKNTVVPKTSEAIIALLVVLALALVSVERNQLLSSDITAWDDTVSKSRGKARPHFNFAVALSASDMSDEAIASYLEAVRLRPLYPEALYNLGVLYDRAAKRELAKDYYKKAIAADPGFGAAYNNLGYLYFKEGLVDEAITEYRRALLIMPLSADVHMNLAVAYLDKGLYGNAIRELEKVLESNPGDEKAIRALESLSGGATLP